MKLSLALVAAFIFSMLTAVAHAYRVHNAFTVGELFLTWGGPLFIVFCAVFAVVYTLSTLGLYTLGATLENTPKCPGGASIPPDLMPPGK